MSKYQYQRVSNTCFLHFPQVCKADTTVKMKDMSNGESGSENPDKAYVIFRVFRLDKDSVDLKIYVDPEVRRQRMELSFTAETWSVVPGSARM